MKRSLKVAVLAACPFPSHQGTQVFVRHLAEAQVRAGHTVELFSYGYGEKSEETGFIHHPVKGLNAGLRSGPSLKRLFNDGLLGWGLRKALVSKSFDILHVHNVEGLLIGLALKLTGIQTPIVYHAHNTMSQELPTYYANGTVRFAMSLIGGAFDRLVPRHADVQIVFDNAHRELQIRHGASHQKVFVAKPGLEGAELQNLCGVPTDLPDARYLVYCGNPDGYQNLSLLWSALRHVRHQLPDVKLLILTRAGPADFGEQALRAFEDESAVFRRYENREEMVSYLKRAEVGVSSRVLSTGFPVKLITYLQLGLRAVACRTSIQPGALENVWLSAGTPESFSQTLITALQAEPRAQDTKSFEVDDSMEAYIKAYDFALNKACSNHIT